MITNVMYKLRKRRFAILNVDAGYTQTRIAEAIDWRREYVNRAIKDGRHVPEKKAQAWADLFGVPLSDLFDPVGEPAPQEAAK